MASRPLFRALLLAASLGWNGVFAQGSNSTSSDGPQVTAFAPVLGVSDTSLLVPTTSSTSSSLSSSTPPIAYSPVTGYTDASLVVPSTPSVTPSPATGHTDISLDVLTTTSSSSRGVTPAIPVTGETDVSLEVPTTRSSRTFRSPVTEQSRTSLDIPTGPTGEGEQDGGQPSSTPTVAHSPATGQSQTSLIVPTTSRPPAPIVVTARPDSELDVPTRGPTNGLVATISLPPENGNGQPTRIPVHQQDDGRPAAANLGGIIASLAHEHGQEWNGAGDQARPQGSTYHLLGTQIVAGASAVTIDGTTYSLAPSGDGIYINGQETTFTGPAATNSVAMAVMSVLNGARATTSEGSSTLATTTSSLSSSVQETGSTSAGAAQQTGNSAALIPPGIGLGGAGLLMALL